MNYSLCHRCDHRVRSIETDGAWGPRCECRVAWSGDLSDEIEREIKRYNRLCQVLCKELYSADTDAKIVHALDGLLIIHHQHDEFLKYLVKGHSSYACYMYSPVKPVVLSDYMKGKDPRPAYMGYFSRRMAASRLPTDQELSKVMVKVGKDEYCTLWYSAKHAKKLFGKKS